MTIQNEIGSDTVRTPVSRGTGARALSPLVLLFLISLMIPIIFYAGPLRFSPYRLLLFAMFLPLVFQWLSGKAGGVLKADLLMLFCCVWASIALGKVHGFGSTIESMGAFTVECFGPYLLARCYVRTAEQFRAVVRCVSLLVMILLPFVAIESITGRPIILQVLSKFATISADTSGAMGKRWGMARAVGPFEHPILFGVFCSSIIALSYFTLVDDRRSPSRFLTPAFAVGNVFFSLSAGPFVSVVMQIGMILWDRIVSTPKRWWILLGLVIAAYVAIDVLSNRTPYRVFIHYLTFSSGSAYNRVLIWEWGSKTVAQFPIFGIGFNDWFRPRWMGSSVDNFWLLIAMRHGLPTVLAMIAAIALIFRGLIKQQDLPEEVQRFRKGLMISLVGVFIAITAVHLWNAAYCWLMFLIGAGVWMFNEPPRAASATDDTPEAEEPTRGRVSYARRKNAAGRRPAHPTTARKARADAPEEPDPPPSPEPSPSRKASKTSWARRKNAPGARKRPMIGAGPRRRG